MRDCSLSYTYLVLYSAVMTSSPLLPFLYLSFPLQKKEPSLFFNGALPATIFSEQALSIQCADLLPDLPTSSVIVQSVSGGGGTSSHSYCEVDSARGSFRSRSVVVGEGTTGEPCNKDVYIHVLVLDTYVVIVFSVY